jgi:hypothetical protein
MNMPTLHVALEQKQLDRFNRNVIDFKAGTQANLIRIANGILEDVLAGRLVHVPKRTPINPIDKDSFSDALDEERAKIPEAPLQNA